MRVPGLDGKAQPAAQWSYHCQGLQRGQAAQGAHPEGELTRRAAALRALPLEPPRASTRALQHDASTRFKYADSPDGTLCLQPHKQGGTTP